MPALEVGLLSKVWLSAGEKCNGPRPGETTHHLPLAISSVNKKQRPFEPKHHCGVLYGQCWNDARAETLFYNNKLDLGLIYSRGNVVCL